MGKWGLALRLGSLARRPPNTACVATPARWSAPKNRRVPVLPTAAQRGRGSKQRPRPRPRQGQKQAGRCRPDGVHSRVGVGGWSSPPWMMEDVFIFTLGLAGHLSGALSTGLRRARDA